MFSFIKYFRVNKLRNIFSEFQDQSHDFNFLFKKKRLMSEIQSSLHYSTKYLFCFNVIDDGFYTHLYQ